MNLAFLKILRVPKSCSFICPIMVHLLIPQCSLPIFTWIPIKFPRSQLASSLCLLAPSIPAALLLGALFDSWSARKALMIPLLGVLLADVNYMFQSLYMDSSVYWLLISDLVFGFAGGFTSIIGLLFAYNVKVSSTGLRSVRVAIMEGALGLGVMCGFLLSGQLRQAFGYSWVFCLLFFLHLLILSFVLLFVRQHPTGPELPPEGQRSEAVGEVERRHILGGSPTGEPAMGGEAERTSGIASSVLALLQKRILDIVRVYRAKREPAAQRCLNIVLIALGVNLFSASGLLDIMFSFLRFRLQWTDREYGWFSGLNSGMNSLSVLLAYPLLHKRVHLSDLQLALAGILAKIGHIFLLAFASSTLVAMCSLVPGMLSRFPTAAMRSMASACVRQHEQGKVFALISLMDGLSSLCASLLFNGLYPYTLSFFAGSMLLLIALLMLIPLGLLLFLHFTGLDKQTTLLLQQPATTSTNDQNL